MRNPAARDRATAELIRDPARSDRMIAAAAGCSHHGVATWRRSLEQSGQIPPASQRARQPDPPRPVRARAEAELRRDPYRSDAVVAAVIGGDRYRVGRWRHALEASGQIPVIASGRRAARLRPRHSARERAATSLKSNAWRSDGMIARAARVSTPTVRKARHQLEAQGKIPRVPPGKRAIQRQRPRPPSPTRLAILLGARTSREVADQAHVTVGAGWKALRAEQRRPPVPRPLPPAQDCEHCGHPFIPPSPPRGKPPRFCSDSCSDAAYKRKRHAAKPPPSPEPRIRELPNPPSWEKGQCTHVPASQASWWTSSNPVLREGAANICGVCAVREPCLEWSLQLPPDDDVIYAGLGREGRRELRRMISDQRAAPVPARP